MRFRLMATYHGIPYQAGLGPESTKVTLFDSGPPPEHLGFTRAGSHWRKKVGVHELDALWQSRPTGEYRGEPCLVLDDLGDRLHLIYLGRDATRAAQLGYWEVDREVFEVVVARSEVTGLAEEQVQVPLSAAVYSAAGAEPDLLARAAFPAQIAAWHGSPDGWDVPPERDGERDRSPWDLGRDGAPDLGRNGTGDLSRNGTGDLSRDGAPDLGRNGTGELGWNGTGELGWNGTGELGRIGDLGRNGDPEPRRDGTGDPERERARELGRNGGRTGRRDRVPARAAFAELADQAAIPRSAWAVGEEVPGAMCLVRAGAGAEVFSFAGGSRREVRLFADEEAAYFYLFGVLAAEAVRRGSLRPPEAGSGGDDATYPPGGN